jgi:DNA-binding response OmpR family regulator
VEFQEPDNDAFAFLFEPRRRRASPRTDDDPDLAHQHLLGRYAVEGYPQVDHITHDPKFTIDSRRSRLTYDRQEVPLTHKELQLLSSLLSADGDLVLYSELASVLWDDEPPPAFAVAIRAHASNIRLKLRAAGIPDDLIKTVDGRGMRLNSSV